MKRTAVSDWNKAPQSSTAERIGLPKAVARCFSQEIASARPEAPELP